MRLLLNHKGYDIEIVQMENEARDKVIISYNAYITNSAFLDKPRYDLGQSDCTYHNGSTVGFDTAHMYNDKMSEAERFMDAIKQAVNWIDALPKEA